MADPAAAFLVGLPAARRRAGIHHLGEGAVAGHVELPALQGAGKGLRQMKSVQRKDGAQARLDPEDLRIVAAVRHRKYPASVSEHQQFGFDDRV
jgi:hypothetical protein